VDAAIILLSSIPERHWGRDVGFSFVAGVPEMRNWRPIPLESLDAANRKAYIATMEQFLRTGPRDLELPFEQRAANTWCELGLDSKAARFVGANDQGTSSYIVGWHCSLHLESLETCAGNALVHGEFDVAADWIELGTTIANEIAESVQSPWIYNYVQKERAKLNALAQSLQQSPSCPRAVAGRMAEVLGRLRPAPARALAAPSAYILPSVYLDNISRAFLSICAVTWAVAGVCWLCLLLGRGARRRELEAGCIRGASPFVLLPTIVLAIVAIGLLEACNYLGEGAGSVGYGIAGIVLTVVLLMGAWWLVARELAPYGDASSVRLRRRMLGLAGCAVIAVAARLLLSFGEGDRRVSANFVQFERWAFDPTHQRLPGILRVAFGLAFPSLLLAYALLRGKRWQRDPANGPLLHPAIVALVGLVLGNWLLFGPFGEWLHGDRSPAPSHPTEWTPSAVATDTFSGVLNDHFYWSRGKTPVPGSEFGRGWNLLTATAALRVTNLGFWLVLACAALWAFEAWRRQRPSRLKDSEEARLHVMPHSMGLVWLTGVGRSCFWLGLIALAIHAWCTLGAAFCVSRVIAEHFPG
jgi:hypothetical protein